MQIIGIILIVIVIALFFAWVKFTNRQIGAQITGRIQEVSIIVKGAYNPHLITVKKGVPLKITFDRQEDSDCSRFVNFPDLKIHKELPAFGKTVIEFTPAKEGEYTFSCDMGMYQGKFIVK